MGEGGRVWVGGCGWAVEAALCWLVVNMGRSLWRGRRE